MKKLRNIFCGLLAAGFIVMSPLVASADAVILHTNDTHCGIAKGLGFARVAAYKHDMQKEHDAVVLVDAGDAVQGEPVGTLSQGADIVKIMNAVGYDFAIPGNHEFDYGMNRFFELAKMQKSGYYSCNFMNLKMNQPVLPSYKFFNLDGHKVAFIGATTPETLVSSTPKFFQDDKGKFIYGFCEDETGAKLYAQVQKTVDAVRAQGADIVILVGHLGDNGAIPVWSSKAVVANTTGIDAVIDGHSHEMYEQQVKNKDGKTVLIAQTGTKFQSLGQITIHDDGTLSAELVKEIPDEDAKVKKLVDKTNAKVAKTLAAPVGNLSVGLTDSIDGVRRVRNGETNLGDVVADAFREAMHTDVAWMNGGSIRASLKPGTVSYQDVMTVLPFGNMLVVKSLTGQQILDALELSAVNYPEEFGGFLQVSDMSYTIDGTIPSPVVLDDKGRFTGIHGERRVKDVKIDGKPLDVNEDYTVASTSYILRDEGNGYTMFADAPLLKESSISETEALHQFFKNHKNVGTGYENAEGQSRITIIE